MENIHQAEQSGSTEPTPQQKRRRIPLQKKSNLLPAIEDPLEFTSNQSGEKARRAFSHTENVQLEIMHHKHYHDRHHHGDENGKRIGIDPVAIENLIRKSVKYLISCSTLVNGFSFVHHDSSLNRATSIVLQEGQLGERLNVVIQAHFVNVSKIQITVMTALVEDEFRLQMGQYCLDLNGGSPILCRKNNKSLDDVFKF